MKANLEIIMLNADVITTSTGNDCISQLPPEEEE